MADDPWEGRETGAEWNERLVQDRLFGGQPAPWAALPCRNCEGPQGSGGDPAQGWCWHCCHEVYGCAFPDCEADRAARRVREDAEARQLEAMLGDRPEGHGEGNAQSIQSARWGSAEREGEESSA